MAPDFRFACKRGGKEAGRKGRAGGEVPRSTLKHDRRWYQVNSAGRDGGLEFLAPSDGGRLATARGRHNRRHLPDHGQDKLFIVVRQCRRISLDVRKEPDLLIGKLAEHLA